MPGTCATRRRAIRASASQLAAGTCAPKIIHRLRQPWHSSLVVRVHRHTDTKEDVICISRSLHLQLQHDVSAPVLVPLHDVDDDDELCRGICFARPAACASSKAQSSLMNDHVNRVFYSVCHERVEFFSSTDRHQHVGMLHHDRARIRACRAALAGGTARATHLRPHGAASPGTDAHARPLPPLPPPRPRLLLLLPPRPLLLLLLLLLHCTLRASPCSTRTSRRPSAKSRHSADGSEALK